jgi:hypothetical protein
MNLADNPSSVITSTMSLLAYAPLEEELIVHHSVDYKRLWNYFESP